MRHITFIRAAVRIFLDALWHLNFRYALVILEIIVFGKRVRKGDARIK